MQYGAPDIVVLGSVVISLVAGFLWSMAITMTS